MIKVFNGNFISHLRTGLSKTVLYAMIFVLFGDVKRPF